MRIPYAIWGMFLAPILVGLVFLLKDFCPADGGMCLADYFAKPIFLPLIAIYHLFGRVPNMNGLEVVLIFLYWALVGFFFGLILDLCKRPPQYLLGQRPPL